MCRSAITAGRARCGASGEPVIRPNGQRKAPDADAPEYGPSRRLDYELELGMWIGRGNELGSADPDRRGGRAYRRLLPAQRLVGARPAGVGISAARAVPGQEFPDQRVALGGQPPRRWRRSASRCRRGRPAIPQPLPYLDDPADRDSGALGIQLEVDADDRARCARRASRRTSCRAARPTRRCTGARRRSSPITASNGCNLQPGDLIGTGTLSTDSDERARLAARDQPGRQAAARACRAAKRAASSRTATK